MKPVLKAVDRVLAGIETVVILVSISVALVLGSMQVILRYAFNTGHHSTEAFFVILTVTAMMFAGSRAVRSDQHVRVDVVQMILPARIRLIAQILSHAVCLALCGYFFYAGLRYVLFLRMMGTISPDTGLPDWMIYSLVPVVLGFFTLRYVICLILRCLDPYDAAPATPHIGGGL